MKYKILLAGRNQTVIDDFFKQLGSRLELMTTSTRYDDILHHIKYVRPDAFIYCIKNEPVETVNKMFSLKTRIMEDDIPFVIIGSESECNDFVKMAINTADIVLTTPIKVSEIEKNIVSDIEQRKQIREDTYSKFRRPDDPNTQNSEKRKHILIIDDNSTMLKALKEHLHGEYDVATAISGKVALKFLEKKTTDLILLDYEMPIENGPAVLEKLRANEATKDIPVIFLTGITERDKIKRALALKPQGYLLKPVDHGKLLAAIESTLNNDRTEF